MLAPRRGETACIGRTKKREWPDEHQSYVVGAGYPRTIIKSDPDIPFEIGKAQAEQSRGESYDSRPEYYAQNPQNWAVSEIDRKRCKA